MSENAVRIALRSMGYENSEMTPHGFQPDVIERHLSHVERNSVRAAYNHAEFLPQRRERMQ